jgi:predicted chitinase
MANSLIGASFADYVYEQIGVRQEKLSLNYSKDDRWQLWQNSNTAFIRLASSIDVNNDNGAMAQKYILFNTIFGGSQASGVNLNNTNTAYGWMTDATDGYGFAPPPGIVSADIKSQNRGSLREANIEILCSNKKQFEIISKLYLRLGYSMLLEWGWSYYYDNKKAFKESYHNIATSTFLFNPASSPLSILNQIKADQFSSCGNYDALIGVVSNYNWNMERDGSYKITLTLKTWGDITESLKSNISTAEDDPYTTVAVVSGSVQPTQLEMSANKSDLHKIFYAIADYLFSNNLDSKNDLEDTFIETESKVLATQLNYTPGSVTGNPEAIQLDFPNLSGFGAKTKHQYITIGALMRIMQDFILMYNTANPNKEALVNLDFNMYDSFCLAPKDFYSLDPRVCIVDFEQGTPTAKVIAPPTGQAGKITSIVYYSNFHVGKFSGGLNFGSNTDFVGRTKYIWVNINHLASILDSYVIRETGAISVYDFLENLMKDVQSALGNINNFEVIYDEAENVIRIIDSTFIPGVEQAFPAKYSKLSVFNVNSLDTAGGSFLRDAKIQSKLSNAFASQTTIGAQANGDVVGADATMLSKFNDGLVDRLVKEKSNKNMQDKVKLEQKYEEVDTKYRLQVDYGAISDDFINSNKQTMIDYYRYYLNREVANGTIPPIGFLPIDLEITMDGLSGIRIYENYTVDSRMLPKDYQDNVKFITTGVSHKIQNNDWTTTLNSVMSPIGKSTKPVTPKGTGTNKKPPAAKSKPAPAKNTPPPVAKTPVSKKSKYKNPGDLNGANATSYVGADWKKYDIDDVFNTAQKRALTRSSNFPHFLKKILRFIKNDPHIEEIADAAYFLATGKHEADYSLQRWEADYVCYKNGKNLTGIPYDPPTPDGVKNNTNGPCKAAKDYYRSTKGGKANYYTRDIDKNGLPYFGRGMIQLTWKDNLQKYANAYTTGVDVADNPELLFQDDQVAFKASVAYCVGRNTFLYARNNDKTQARYTVNRSKQVTVDKIWSYHLEWVDILTNAKRTP